MQRILITTPGIRKALRHFKYYQAIAEYIWNGFDAQASSVEIRYDTNSIGSLSNIKIIDNGYGIPFEELDRKFIPFFESDKEIDPNSTRNTSAVHGKNGVGRLTFFHFSSVAKWTTVYNKNGKRFKYDIKINNDRLEEYNHSELKEVDEPTGTIVLFSGIHTITADHIKTEVMKYLMKEFGWFLELNKANKFSLKINESVLDYSEIITDHENIILNYPKNDISFEVRYIQWVEKINNEYSRYYFINTSEKELLKKTTTLNNKGDHFYHSVFIKSKLFDEFDSREDINVSQGLLFGHAKSNKEFQFLMTEVDQFLRKKRKPFLRVYTDKLIMDFEQNGAFPSYNKQNLWERSRNSELENVVRELYQVEPKIFSTMNTEQKKTFVRLIDLVIDAGEKDRLFEILVEIVELDTTEREELAEILKTSRMSRIISTINLIRDRFKAIEEFQRLVFDKSLKANEPDHIQKFVEKHYWIFGEQYHLVTAAEPKFEEALRRYIYLLSDEKVDVKIAHPDKNKEMDIFMVRQDLQNDIIKNIVVELKNPKVRLGKKQLDQVDKYLSVILSQDEFNASNMFWEFYLVGNGFDGSGYIKRQFENAKAHGEKSLVFKTDRYKIYVKTWSEIFTEFELRHKFLNDKLELERDKLLENEIDADVIIQKIDNNAAVQKAEIQLVKD